jgi:hypothetical protein
LGAAATSSTTSDTATIPNITGVGPDSPTFSQEGPHDERPRETSSQNLMAKMAQGKKMAKKWRPSSSAPRLRGRIADGSD